MEIAVRSPLKAGVIALSASAIAVSAFVPPPAVQLPASADVREVAVQLAAAYNPLQPWIDDFEAAGANVKALGQAFFQAPAVLLQQFLANQIDHIGTILKNPGNIGSVLQGVAHNVQSVIKEATLLGTDPADWTIADSNDVWHGLVAQMLPTMLPTAGNTQATAFVTQVVNVLASPLSGVLMGLVGPAVSPVVALVNSITAIGNALFHGNLAKAVQAAINIPASVVNGFLNGANLNLDALAPLITKTMPAGNSLGKLNIQFGGLLTAGTTGMDLSGIGGSILNSLGLIATTTLAPDDPLPITGQGVGPIGALLNLTHLLAKALGWSGTGNPLAAKSTSATTATTTTAAVSGAATSIPSATTTGVTVSAAAVTKSGAAAAENVSSGKSDNGTADTTVATNKKSGASDATDSDSTSDASAKSDSSKSDSTKRGSKRSSTKGDSASGVSTKRASKQGSANSGSRHHGKSHASSGSHSS